MRMDMVVGVKENSNEDKIKMLFDILKKQLDQYDTASEITKSKAELTKNERIQKLMLQERHLSEEYQKISKEIKRYERKYEKVLKKKVKLMKMQIKENRQKLDIIKGKYHEFDAQVNVAPYKVKKAKNVSKPIKVKVMLPKFKQKNAPLSKKIKMKIKRNEKLGKREVQFVKDDNVQPAFTDLVKIVRPITTNIQECRIMLQKLTEEQMNQYGIRNRLRQQKTKKARITRDSVQKVNQSDKVAPRPSWHIKIPKAVFEESLKEADNSDQNLPSTSKTLS